MTYKELEKEDYYWLIYHQIIITSILCKQKIVRLFEYSSSPDMQTMVFFKENEAGKITTKKLTCDAASMVFVRNWLSRDCPDAEYLNIDSDLKEVQ